MGTGLYVFGGVAPYISDITGQWEESLSKEISVFDLLKTDAKWKVIETDHGPGARTQHIAVAWNELLIV